MQIDQRNVARRLATRNTPLPGRRSAAPGVDKTSIKRSQPSELEGRPDLRAPEKSRGWRGWAAAAGMALAVTGGVVGMVGAAGPAYAQTVSTVQSADAVSFRGAQDLVERFSGEKQLYVQGQPLSEPDLAELQGVLEQHPNVFVALIDNTTNVVDFDYTASRGIGNHPDFLEVRNEVTQEREGVVVMVYFNSDQGRKIYMRSEELPDRLGVGEENFANADGSPGPLLRTFLAARDKGKNMPGMLEEVFTQINGTIDQRLAQEESGATSAISTASGQVGRLKEEFQVDVSGWEARLGQARQALEAKDFGTALELAEGVSGEVSARFGELDQVRQLRLRAEEAVATAREAVARGTSAVETLKKEQPLGPLSEIDTEPWQARLEAAAANPDHAQAAEQARTLVGEIETHLTAIDHHRLAGETAEGLQEALRGLSARVADLPQNGAGQQAREAFSLAQARFEQYQNEFKAQQPGALDSAQEARGQLNEGLRLADKSEADEAARVRNLRIAIGAASVAVVTGMVVLAVRAKGKRKVAQEAVAAANREVAARSQELLAKMDEADYQDLAGYSGATERLVRDTMANLGDALTLVGGADKFLDEAEKLSKANSLKDFFLAGDYKEAVELLDDPETKRSFNFGDSARLVLEGPKAESWREELKRRGPSREFEVSFSELLEVMGEKTSAASAQLSELSTKTDGIVSFLDQAESGARELSRKATEHQAGGGLFQAPSVGQSMVPMVLGEENSKGLVARGRDLQAEDPVGAWDRFAAPANRLVQEGESMLTFGRRGREVLEPLLAGSEQKLHPHGVQTRWAREQLSEFSQELDALGHQAVRGPVGGKLGELERAGSDFETRVKKVVALDEQRRQVLPGEIAGVDADIAAGRQRLDQELKGLGYYRAGQADGVLREAGRDPSENTREARQHLGAIKGHLDTGDVEGAEQQKARIKELGSSARGLVSQTEKALQRFPKELAEDESQIANLEAQISRQANTHDSLRSSYTSSALSQAAQESGSGRTLGDDVKNTRGYLGQSRAHTQQARSRADQAKVLGAMESLGGVEAPLQQARQELAYMDRAADLLANKLSSARGQVNTLQGQLSGLESRASASYVTRASRRLVGQARSATEQAARAVSRAPVDPYEAASLAAQASRQMSQADNAVDHDIRVYHEAQSAVGSASSAVSSARSAVSSASGRTFSWSNNFGSVRESVSSGDLSSARSSLRSAESELSSAQRRMNSQDYSGATSDARQASRYASSARSAADDAVSRARSRFERKKRPYVEQQRREEERQRRIREAEEKKRREAERQRAEAQRREQQRRERSNGSGGGNVGRGGSGSRGGGW